MVCAAMLTACGGSDKDGVRMGSLSGEFDSLSYAIGANIGYGIDRDLSDIPFDYARFDEGMEDGALNKVKVDREQMMQQLRTYFMTKRFPRLQALRAQRAEADSIRRANGDTTKVEYGSDPSLFASDGERDSISYAFGNNWGYSIRQAGVPVQIVWVLEAMKEVRGGKARMSEQQMQDYIRYYYMEKLPAENLKASTEWLEKTAKKSGVHKTESGLLYKIEKLGDTSVMAKDNRDRVKVHYKGTTRKEWFSMHRVLPIRHPRCRRCSKTFPEDYDKDEPIDFPLNQVIKGWTEGMKFVGKGGKITLWVPADLAYGQRGAGNLIGPNEALRFDVDLIDVEPYVEIDTTKAVKVPALEEVKIK